MKKNQFFSVLGVMLAVLSCVYGGGMMADAIVGETGSDTDPNDGKPLDNATSDDLGKGIDQHGQGATGSALTDAELVENQINDYVSKFQAYDYPMHTDFLRKARQIKVDTKEPEDYQIGEAIMEANTKGEIADASNTNSVTLTTAHLYKNDLAIFQESSTILVENVNGGDGFPLVLYVTGNTKNTSIEVTALNASAEGGIPTIPAGTKFYVMAPALSESEVEVAPDSAYPQPSKCYLQKKVCAMTYTDLFARIKKKANWNVQDIKDWQLAMFRKKCSRTLLISAPSKFLKQGDKRTGTEYCYTQEGVLRQIRLGYQIGGTITVNDLIAMQRMVFSKYNNGVKEVDVYCGTNALERLHNIDFSKHPEIQFKRSTIGETQITVSSFESTFGKFNFMKEQALDDIGYSEFMILFSMAKAKRFYYENGKTLNIDHSKGEGGEVREAKSQYYIQDDCLKLADMNSMIVGPTITLGANVYGTITALVKSVTALPDSGKAGDMVYLVQAEGSNAIGLYKYSGSAWIGMEGSEIHV
jgi:hypothetical protein